MMDSDSFMDAIHKIITWVLSPMGVLFLGLFLGWLLRKTSWKKLGAGVIGLTLLFVWVLGCSITTRLIGVPLEGEEVDICEEPVEALGRVDAIVLLGGGMGVHDQCGRAEMFSAADRAWMAARLWRKLKVQPVLTVSGGGAKGEIALLSDLGVNTNCVVNLEQAKNTEDEAKLVNELVVSRPLLVASNRTELTTNDYQLTTSKPRVLLVTSAWHMPRARMLFERAGLDVLEAPTDYEMHLIKERGISVGDFFPGADAMVSNSYALKEWVARFCYWLKR